MTNDLPELISVKELQKYLDCSQTIAYHIIKDRRFPSLKIHGKWYINKSKLADWIERQSVKIK